MFSNHAARHGVYHVGGCKLLWRQLSYSITKTSPCPVYVLAAVMVVTVITADKKLQQHAGSAALTLL